MSKVIVNRLKPILKSIISETQSAFVADRLITDNILIAFESLHHMKTQCFLFLFCAEGLNALLYQAANNGEIQGYSICRASPKITHLFFADDCLLFCRATSIECSKIQSILAWYEAASGQQVNSDTTTAFFSQNTSAKTRRIKSFIRGAGCGQLNSSVRNKSKK